MPLRQQLAESFRERSRSFDFWLTSLLYVFLAIAFWPLTQWVATTTHDQSRLLHALVVLVMATVLLIRFGGVRIERTLQFNASARNTLTLAYVLLLLVFLAPFVIPEPSTPSGIALAATSITAYCAAIASLVFFVFGERIRRVVFTATGTFGVFLFFSLLVDALDWPLRSLAGNWSARLLDLLGKQTELGLMQPPGEPPQLILLVDRHPFHVAAECNGFGVILTSLVIAVLLSLYRKLGPLDFLRNLAVGLALGFAFNILRILIIVLLAPGLMDHYMLMHEIVGGISFWACLVLLWLLLKGPVRDEPGRPEAV